MIKSLNTHDEVIKKIKQNGFKKIDYLGIDINEIWLNFSLKDGLAFKSKKFKDGKFFNSNIMKRTIEFNKDLLLNSEVFILKNEYFGFDSKKINFFRTKEGLISERFFHEIGIKQGPIQTLLFIQKDIKTNKAYFDFIPSAYWFFIYGEDSFEANYYWKKIKEIIFKITGAKPNNLWKLTSNKWPKINRTKLLEDFLQKQKIYQPITFNDFLIYISDEINWSSVKYEYLSENEKISTKDKKEYGEKSLKYNLNQALNYKFNEVMNKYTDPETRYIAENFYHQIFNYLDLPYLKFFKLNFDNYSNKKFADEFKKLTLMLMKNAVNEEYSKMYHKNKEMDRLSKKYTFEKLHKKYIKKYSIDAVLLIFDTRCYWNLNFQYFFGNSLFYTLSDENMDEFHSFLINEIDYLKKYFVKPYSRKKITIND